MLTLSLAAVLSVSTGAPAPAPTQQDADEAARVGTVGGVTVYDFEDDSVEGELLSPEGANLTARGRAKHASLIEIRPHFIPELIRMSYDL